MVKSLGLLLILALRTVSARHTPDIKSVKKNKKDIKHNNKQ